MGKGILVVGLTCIDVINYVDKYPAEDSDSRVKEQVWSLGGNAANNVTVLNQLNTHTTLFAALPSDNVLLERLMDKQGISRDRCVRRGDCDLPLSTIIVNESTGTRTIMHYRGNLPELTCEEFKANFANFDTFSWIHFEGRNFDEVLLMVEYVREKRIGKEGPRISVECEKIRSFPTMERTIPLADVVFVSKDFARSKGFTNKEDGVAGIQREFGASMVTVICPWGDKGAAGRRRSDDEMVSVDAYCECGEAAAIDTLAAGDCFIGCCIHFLNEGHNLRTVLERSCKITGRKVAKRGLLALDLS